MLATRRGSRRRGCCDSRRHAVSVLSIDLALISYRDVGAALVQSAPSGERTARVIRLTQGGRPTTDALVGWMEQVAEREQVRCRAIDGPLGWRGPDTDSPHSRLSERAVRAPGKTGLPPDGVKPRTYLEFSRLSIAIFERLTARGWRLPADPTGREVRGHRTGVVDGPRPGTCVVCRRAAIPPRKFVARRADPRAQGSLQSVALQLTQRAPRIE